MDDINFYMRLAKPLALNLPDAKDRTLAARWLKKLCQVDQLDVGTSANIRVEYLKLLLFVMQGNRLTGIFEKPPPTGDLQEILQPMSEQRKTAKDMIALAKEGKTSVPGKFQLVRDENPPLRKSIGGDMCEYVAIQEIPDFGIHGYYALSTEPMSNWWNPPISASASEQKTLSPPCFKNTCKNATVEPTANPRDLGEIDQSAMGERRPKSNNSKISNRLIASSANERSNFRCVKTKHHEKSLQKIFETRRSEIAEVEMRPCWGGTRYIDRLIDESPHLVGDIDMSEADALLNLYRERKLRKIKKTGKEESKSDLACAISSKRKQIEAKLDMPPCASIPNEKEDFEGHSNARLEMKLRTCFPQENELERLTDQDQIDQQGCCTESEVEDSYHNYSSVTSVESISLRGGGSAIAFGGGSEYVDSEFQYNHAYEELCQDCTDRLRNNTEEVLETNHDDINWRKDRDN